MSLKPAAPLKPFSEEKKSFWVPKIRPASLIEKPSVPQRRSVLKSNTETAHDINLNLETLWFTHLNNISLFPIELQTHKYEAMFKSESGSEMTTLLALQYQDLSRTVISITWNVKSLLEKPPVVVQTHKRPTKLSLTELQKISQDISPAIFQFCLFNSQKKISNLVSEALSFASCMEPQNQVFGYLILSKDVSPAIDKVRRGDVIKFFPSVKEAEQAVGIVADIDEVKNLLSVFIQDSMNCVQRRDHVLSNLDTISVYRPMKREYLRPLIEELF